LEVAFRNPDIDGLLSALREADQKTNHAWLSSLSRRKLDELEFHDHYRDGSTASALSADEQEQLYGNKKYYCTTGASQNYAERWIRDHSRGKVVLDYACGNGRYAFEAAQSGAQLVIGLDISRISIENCRHEAEERGLADNTFFIQGDCENTGLPDSSVDTVICSGMLHHLDLSYAFPELRRVMRPGGRCIAMEALDHNPFIKLYRRLTPAMRTRWESEHILSLDDLRFARRFFDLGEVRFWHFFSILATPMRSTPFFNTALKCGNAADNLLLRIPPFTRLAWTFTFELIKRPES
jgi:SAM-dependent methyltransferase